MKLYVIIPVVKRPGYKVNIANISTNIDLLPDAEIVIVAENKTKVIKALEVNIKQSNVSVVVSGDKGKTPTRGAMRNAGIVSTIEEFSIETCLNDKGSRFLFMDQDIVLNGMVVDELKKACEQSTSLIYYCDRELDERVSDRRDHWSDCWTFFECVPVDTGVMFDSYFKACEDLDFNYRLHKKGYQFKKIKNKVTHTAHKVDYNADKWLKKFEKKHNTGIIGSYSSLDVELKREMHDSYVPPGQGCITTAATTLKVISEPNMDSNIKKIPAEENNFDLYKGKLFYEFVEMCIHKKPNTEGRIRIGNSLLTTNGYFTNDIFSMKYLKKFHSNLMNNRINLIRPIADIKSGNVFDVFLEQRGKIPYE